MPCLLPEDVCNGVAVHLWLLKAQHLHPGFLKVDWPAITPGAGFFFTVEKLLSHFIYLVPRTDSSVCLFNSQIRSPPRAARKQRFACGPMVSNASWSQDTIGFQEKPARLPGNKQQAGARFRCSKLNFVIIYILSESGYGDNRG